MGSRRLWLSSEKMTVMVRVDGQNRILDCAPIVQRFKGQLVGNLIGWMQKQGGFRREELGKDEV
jgi:hypothetical protein